MPQSKSPVAIPVEIRNYKVRILRCSIEYGYVAGKLGMLVVYHFEFFTLPNSRFKSAVIAFDLGEGAYVETLCPDKVQDMESKVIESQELTAEVTLHPANVASVGITGNRNETNEFMEAMRTTGYGFGDRYVTWTLAENKRSKSGIPSKFTCVIAFQKPRKAFQILCTIQTRCSSFRHPSAAMTTPWSVDGKTDEGQRPLWFKVNPDPEVFRKDGE